MSTADFPSPRPRSILIVDDDADIMTVVALALSNEGLEVHHLHDVREEPVFAAINRIAPDCVLLDSAAHDGYGSSWELAALLSRRSPPVPVVMFTAHRRDTDEARTNQSARSQAARFAGVLTKPFALDDIIAVVMQALRTDHRES